VRVRYVRDTGFLQVGSPLTVPGSRWFPRAVAQTCRVYEPWALPTARTRT
jgi:hypothetical protein